MRIGILTGGGDVPGLNPAIKAVAHGTFLHSSRTNPGKVRQQDGGRVDCTPHVMHVIEHLGLDLLIPIGADDTLSYGERLSREGVPVIAIPKTMDNDAFGMDYCIGFSTAVSRRRNDEGPHCLWQRGPSLRSGMTDRR
jgi:6-phosphofructokinase